MNMLTREISRGFWNDLFAVFDEPIFLQQIGLEVIGTNGEISAALHQVQRVRYDADLDEVQINTDAQEYVLEYPEEIYVEEEWGHLKAIEIESGDSCYLLTLRHSLLAHALEPVGPGGRIEELTVNSRRL